MGRRGILAVKFNLVLKHARNIKMSERSIDAEEAHEVEMIAITSSDSEVKVDEHLVLPVEHQKEEEEEMGKQDRRYRPDVDGLRALAVSAVILHHWWAELVPGGFVGVDIFFVISGFLITGIIRREGERFSLATFYRRRIQRIFPALAVMLVVVTVACSFILVGEAAKSFEWSVYWSVVSFGNFYTMFLPTGYWDTPTKLVPLLHLWSLGVEEQFYFAWPLLLKFLPRDTQFVRHELLLIGLVLLSFGGATLLVILGLQRFAYYMLPGRLGELAIGGILALMQDRIQRATERWDKATAGEAPLGGVVGRAKAYCCEMPVSFWIKNAMCLLGAALVGISIGLFNPSLPFPGFLAMIPCLGACLLIGFGGPKVAVSIVLSLPPVVSIGLISYSTYLYHWPIMALARNQGMTLAGWSGLHAAVYSFVAGWLSYIFVEEPTRRSKIENWKVFVLFAICGGAVMGLAAIQMRYSASVPIPLPVNSAGSSCCTGEVWRHCTKHSDCVDVGVCGSNETVEGLVCFGDPREPAFIFASQVGNISYPSHNLTQPVPPLAPLRMSSAFSCVACAGGDRNECTSIDSTCLLGNGGKNPTTFVFGDSHTYHFARLWNEVGALLNFSLVMKSAGGFQPNYAGAVWEDKLARIFTGWSRPFDYVVVSFSWTLNFGDSEPACDTPRWFEEVFVPQMPPNQTLIIMLDTPYFDTFSKGCASGTNLDSSDCRPFFSYRTRKTCNPRLIRLASRFPDKIKIWDFNVIFCPEGFCSPWIGFKPNHTDIHLSRTWYEDEGHLRNSEYILKTIIKNLGLPEVLRKAAAAQEVLVPANQTLRSLDQIIADGFSFN